MLPDDELDFEDFGDLGDIDGPELTNEELEALEKELRDENASTLTQVEKGEQEKQTSKEIAPASTLTSDTTTLVEKQEEKTVNNNLEEGETPNDVKSVPKKPVFAQRQPQQQPNFSKYNNNYKFNAYNRNGFYNQKPIPMNNMFPQYPPFSNRIYVNPKFNKGAGGASQQMQLQQQQQQRFMEMEAQRMLLMQRQMQLQQQEQQRVDQKRREATEIMRKKQEQKNGESGEKRPRSEDSNYENRAAKRQERFTSSSAGGITIKGVAAAARNNNLPPKNIPYQPPNERRELSPYDRKSTTPFDRKPYEKPSITTRLGNSGNSAVSRAATVPNKNSSALTTATPVLPIVTNGKSNILIIKGLSKDTKEQDIRAMTNEINGGAHDINLDSSVNSATVTFSSVESAVTFRRKYNRFQMGESHINISFQK